MGDGSPEPAMGLVGSKLIEATPLALVAGQAGSAISPHSAPPPTRNWMVAPEMVAPVPVRVRVAVKVTVVETPIVADEGTIVSAVVVPMAVAEIDSVCVPFFKPPEPRSVSVMVGDPVAESL